MIKFTIIGEPKGKGRPRFRSRGKFVQTYTDDATINYENLVKMSYLNSNKVSYLNDKPLWCHIDVYQSIPKSTSKKKTEQMLIGEIRPTKKPDIDNIVKSILDALNKVAFNDDTQIVDLQCRKFYSNVPRVEVTIDEEVSVF